MAKLKIILIPPGFAPEYIRKQWVGLEIKLPTEQELLDHPISGMGIGQQNSGGYDVLRSDAVAALKKAQRYEAAEYWESLVIGYYLRFKKEVCTIVE